MPPRRRPRGLYANAQLAPRRRMQRPIGDPVVLNATEVRLVLLRAIKAGDVKPGHGQYTGGWRWDGVTVTNRVNELDRGGWVKVHDEPRRRIEVLELGDQMIAANGGPP